MQTISEIPSGKSIKVDEVEYVQYLIEAGKVFVNKELNSNFPLMAAPIYYNGKLSAIITINGLKFDRFSTLL